MTPSEPGDSGWTWELYDRAQRQFDRLDAHAQDRITSKLDDIVADEWREPDDYIEPLTGAPHGKLRIGPFRLGVEADRDTQVLNIYTIEKREGAYQADDD